MMVNRFGLHHLTKRDNRHNFKNIFQCIRYLWRTEGPRGYVAGE